MKANYMRQDEQGRHIYMTPKGEELVMVDGSLYHLPTPHTLELEKFRDEVGNYVTLEDIDGIKPHKCCNCGDTLGIRYASKKRAEYRKHTGKEVPDDVEFLCMYCDIERNR